MRNEEQRIWHDYMAIYTPTEERPWNWNGEYFTSIRALMKYIRGRHPDREWKAVKFMAYNRPSHSVKYTYDKKGDE